MASTPYARVHALIGTPAAAIPVWQSHRSTTKTPLTLTGSPTALYSYEMRIAWRDGSDWVVTNERSSPTTNRHIRAAHAAISALPGYGEPEPETFTERRRMTYSGFQEFTVPVTRYRRLP